MIDLDRPPAALPPRLPLGVKLLALWAVLLVVYLTVLVAISGPQLLDLLTVTILLAVLISAAIVLSWVQRRLVNTGDILSRVLQARGMRVGDPENDLRPSDREEREARRELRRGDITRGEYERRVARRRFAHGDITLAEYHEILRELGDQDESVHPRA